MRILKDFKSFVLEVFIAKGLRACFAEVRIVKDLGEKQLKTEGLGLEFFGGAWEVPPPRVFFVRMADKGLTFDAASRASTFGELNAET